MSSNQHALGWRLSGRIWLARASRRPDFRAAILGCGLWLLFVHAYEPWRYYYHGYRPGSLFQGAGFFFWRIGFNISHNTPVVIGVGLASIALLMYVFGWVVRGLFGLEPSANLHPAPPHLKIPRINGRQLAKIAKLALGVIFTGILLGAWILDMARPDLLARALRTFPGNSPAVQSAQAPEAQPPNSSPPPGFQLADNQTPPRNATDEVLANTPPGIPVVVAPPRPAILRELSSPPTGTWIRWPHGARGAGVLRIQNGTDFDSAVKLVTVAVPRKVLWAVFIRAHEEKTVNGIAQGDYLLRFSFGRNWDRRARKFLSDASFYQAGKDLDFTGTEPDANGPGEYTKFDVTLHEVPNGNLRRQKISEALFNEGESGNSEQTARVRAPVPQ